MRITLFYLPGELEPVLSGNIDVHEDEMGGPGLDLGEHFIPLCSLFNRSVRESSREDLSE